MTINQLVNEFARIIESPATKSLQSLNPFDQPATQPVKAKPAKSSKKKAAA